MLTDSEKLACSRGRERSRNGRPREHLLPVRCLSRVSTVVVIDSDTDFDFDNLDILMVLQLTVPDTE
jgi:hypothetical protein